MNRISLLAPALLALAAPLAATPAADALAAGRYAEAVTLGRNSQLAADRMAAARAASVIATYQVTDRAEARRILEAAVADANAAIALDPGNPALLLDRAIIVGYLGKVKGSAGDARASRRDVEAVLVRQPNNALAIAVLGGWHGEAVATVGSFLAGTALGARKSESIRLFDRAIALDPGSALYPTYYAMTLLQLDAGNAQRARELLAKAGRNRADDAYQRLVQANGQQVLAALEAGDTARARVLAKQLSPLGRVKA